MDGSQVLRFGRRKALCVDCRDIGELRYLVVTPNLWEHPVRIQPPPNPSIAKPKWDVDHDFLFSFQAADAVEKDNGDFRL